MGRLPPVSARLLAIVSLVVCAGAAALVLAFTQEPSAPDLTDPQRFAKAARQAIAQGREREAEAMARSRGATDSAAAAVLGYLAVRHGRYDEAIQILEPAASAEPLGDAALELGILQQRLGRAEAAARLLSPLTRPQAGVPDTETLLRAARAAQALGRAQEANALYRGAAATGSDPEVEAAWGSLFVETYNAPEALRAFQQAVRLDTNWAPAHLGLARVVAEENPPAAAAAATRAVEIDPLLAAGHLFLADLDLDNSRYDAALERINRVLAFNASHLEARAMLAAIAYVRDDRAAFDAEVKRILDINPAYGEVYRAAADLAARNYRFEEAVVLAHQAVRLDPTSSRAHAELGLHLMRTGDEVEARRSLERAWSRDRFNRVTYNLLTVLDRLDKFTVVRDGDVTFKFHPDEAPVLREYALPLTRDALRTLSEKYQFTPTGPIIVEIFPVHDDFAVRTLGLPGMIGALGACFGRVVTLDSPKARPPGTFSWQATLWHELAHVITLQMSNQRVPRWLTEGISVYEEGRARPEWGRDMEIPFAVALERGETLKLKDLNAGFTKPETIALAYYQASLLVDHIVSTHGEAALRTLLRAYGSGVDGDAAITKALGVSIEQLQGSFDKFVEPRFAKLRAALRPGLTAAARETVKEIDGLREAAIKSPDSYDAQLALGRALAAAKDPAAFAPLERASALVPMATGDDSPHALMARLAEDLGDTSRAIREYRALLEHDHAAVEPARRLAAIVAKVGDDDAAALAHQRIVAIDPFDAEGHTGLGRLALKNKDVATAMREFKAALALGPADRAAAHCDLGETYLLAGMAVDAKTEALAALEIAPSFERAQELLLKAVEKTDGAAR